MKKYLIFILAMIFIAGCVGKFFKSKEQAIGAWKIAGMETGKYLAKKYDKEKIAYVVPYLALIKDGDLTMQEGQDFLNVVNSKLGGDVAEIVEAMKSLGVKFGDEKISISDIKQLDKECWEAFFTAIYEKLAPPKE